MSFFDGKHKTTPKINLAGSSRQVNIELLIINLYSNSNNFIKSRKIEMNYLNKRIQIE